LSTHGGIALCVTSTVRKSYSVTFRGNTDPAAAALKPMSIEYLPLRAPLANMILCIGVTLRKDGER
jgi:hypothetical protein